MKNHLVAAGMWCISGETPAKLSWQVKWEMMAGGAFVSNFFLDLSGFEGASMALFCHVKIVVLGSYEAVISSQIVNAAV